MTSSTTTPTGVSTAPEVPVPRSAGAPHRSDGSGGTDRIADVGGVAPAPRPAVPADVPTPPDPACRGLAWIVREVTHVPGVLRLRAGRLSFVSTRGVLFDAPPDDLALVLGRTGRSGFRVTSGGEDLRIRVVRPVGAVTAPADLVARCTEDDDPPATDGDAAAGARWRALLAPLARDRAGLRGLGWCSTRSRPASAGRAHNC